MEKTANNAASKYIRYVNYLSGNTYTFCHNLRDVFFSNTLMSCRTDQEGLSDSNTSSRSVQLLMK